jgi:hypothetical protein
MSDTTQNDANVHVVQEGSSNALSRIRESVERLKADLRKAQPFPDGTIVKFTSVAVNTGQHYHYAAIFTAGYWWFTGQGNGYFPKQASHQEFTALMVSKGHTITALGVALDFETIEL